MSRKAVVIVHPNRDQFMIAHVDTCTCGARAVEGDMTPWFCYKWDMKTFKDFKHRGIISPKAKFDKIEVVKYGELPDFAPDNDGNMYCEQCYPHKEEN